MILKYIITIAGNIFPNNTNPVYRSNFEKFDENPYTSAVTHWYANEPLVVQKRKSRCYFSIYTPFNPSFPIPSLLGLSSPFHLMYILPTFGK